MNALKQRLGAASLLIGSLISSSNIPSLAADNACHWYHLRGHETIQRDDVLRQESNANRACLGDAWCQLDAEHRAILFQAQQDSAGNGGRLSYAEQRQLNQEQDQLQGEINAALRRI